MSPGFSGPTTEENNWELSLLSDFIDLKTQQNRIKNQLDANIQKVFAHGQYIMSPEAKELEEKLERPVFNGRPITP